MEKIKLQLEAHPDHPDSDALKEELKDLRKRAKTPGFKFNPETSPLNEADLLVLDEVSMVDKNVAADLMSFNVPILALGDPAQLPPVGNGGYFTKGGEKAADALLTQVERHTGAVIDLATQIRETRERPDTNGETVVRRIGQSKVLEFDQVLVGTNKTRWAKNRTLRKLLGRGPDLLYPTERIICLSNSKELGVLNGQQFIVGDIRGSYKTDQTELFLSCECPDPGEVEQAEFCTVCRWKPRWIPVWDFGFQGMKGEAELSEIPFHKQQAAMSATYGYAITVHKSQGSEWGRVLVVDESPVFRKDGWRWLYTAVTRAQQDVVVLKG
jgi:exodeoxyribonuclease-5